jgi:cytochrome c556
LSKRLIIIAALVATSAAGFAAAQDAEDVAEARIAYYDLIGSDMGVLSAMAKGEVPYDPGVAKAHADNIALLSRYLRDHLYVEGSSNADLPGKTRTLAEVWSDRSGYLAREADFDTAAAALAQVAGDGLPALQEGVTQLGGTCRACHQTYRAEDF